MRFHILTKLYDPYSRLLFNKVFEKIVTTIPFQASQSLLDIGCGPGNLLLKIGKSHQDLKLTGIDIDPELLKIAYKKLKSISSIKLIQTSATQLPFNNEIFDIIVTTLVLHHLDTEQKQQAIKEMYRVLKTNGTLWCFDFGPSTNLFAKIIMKVFRHIEKIDDNISGKIIQMLQETGFQELKTQWNTYGIFTLLSAKK